MTHMAPDQKPPGFLLFNQVSSNIRQSSQLLATAKLVTTDINVFATERRCIRPAANCSLMKTYQIIIQKDKVEIHLANSFHLRFYCTKSKLLACYVQLDCR